MDKYILKVGDKMDNKKAIKIIENIKKVIIGKDEVIEKVLIAILARGSYSDRGYPGSGENYPGQGLGQKYGFIL